MFFILNNSVFLNSVSLSTHSCQHLLPFISWSEVITSCGSHLHVPDDFSYTCCLSVSWSQPPAFMSSLKKVSVFMQPFCLCLLASSYYIAQVTTLCLSLPSEDHRNMPPHLGIGVFLNSLLAKTIKLKIMF